MPLIFNCSKSKIRNDINGSDDEEDNDRCSDDSWDDDGHIFEDSSRKLPPSIPNEDRSIPGIPFNPFVASSGDISGKDSVEVCEEDIEENDDEMNALVDLLEDFGNQQMKAEDENIPSGGKEAESEDYEDSANVFESENPEDDQHMAFENQPSKPVPPPRPSFKN